MNPRPELLPREGAAQPELSAEELLPLVYDELRSLAKRRMAGEKPGQTLQATALVHEAWIKIAGSGNERFANRQHFFKAAAEAMQRILIDVARRKQTAKRGAKAVVEELQEWHAVVPSPPEELLAINDALAGLALEDAQGAEIVRLRYFVGLTIPEIAAVLDLSPSTVDRHWAFGRAWLKRTIRAERRGSGEDLGQSNLGAN